MSLLRISLSVATASGGDEQTNCQVVVYSEKPLSTVLGLISEFLEELNLSLPQGASLGLPLEGQDVSTIGADTSCQEEKSEAQPPSLQRFI